jgi:ribosomal protein L40E
MLLLALASVAFNVLASPETKRVWFPRGAILSGILFVGFVAIVMPPHVLWGVIPAALAITALNVFGTKICGRCGALNYRYRPPYNVDACQKCGADLTTTAPSSR